MGYDNDLSYDSFWNRVLAQNILQFYDGVPWLICIYLPFGRRQTAWWPGPWWPRPASGQRSSDHAASPPCVSAPPRCSHTCNKHRLLGSGSCPVSWCDYHERDKSGIAWVEDECKTQKKFFLRKTGIFMELCKRLYDLHKKEIQGLLCTITEIVLFFKDSKALRKQWQISSTFKHFKDMYEPWQLFKVRIKIQN